MADIEVEVPETVEEQMESEDITEETEMSNGALKEIDEEKADDVKEDDESSHKDDDESNKENEKDSSRGKEEKSTKTPIKFDKSSPTRRSSQSLSSLRGGFRGRRGGGLNINTRYIDSKAMYLVFEKPINAQTAKEVIEYGKDGESVGFGRGITIHLKTPEEAKELMETIKGMKFNGLTPRVEHAYKKRGSGSDAEKRNSSEGAEETESSPTKKIKVDENFEGKIEDDAEEDNYDDGDDDADDGDDVGDVHGNEQEGEEGGEEAEDAEVDGEGEEAQEVDGEEYEEADAGEEHADEDQEDE